MPPLTYNVATLREKIVESITIFVKKKVLEVSSETHKGATNDDFFVGKYNGN